MAESTLDWHELALPMHKGKPGWEFTELKNFDLDAYGTAAPGNLGDAARAVLVLDPPPGGVTLTQVDHAYQPASEARDPDPAHPLIMPLSEAVRTHGELVDRHLGSLVGAGENVFTARNAAEWEGGAFVYVPRGVAV